MRIAEALIASNLKRSVCEAILQPLTKVDSMNPINSTNSSNSINGSVAAREKTEA